MDKRNYDDDEINLADYINVIVKRKTAFLTIFFCSVLGASIFVSSIPKTYLATSMILITPIKADVSRLNSQGGIDSSNHRSALSLPTHKVLLKSNIVLERIISHLNLKGKNGQMLQPEGLFSQFTVKEEAATNIFRLCAVDRTPDLAMELANAWAKVYIQYSRELVAGEIEGTTDVFSDNLNLAEKKLVEAEQKLLAFKEQYNVDSMRMDLDRKQKTLDSYKTAYMNREIREKIQRKETRTIRFEKEYLQRAINTTEKELAELAKNVNQKQTELNQLVREAEQCKTTYNNLFSEIEETRIMKSGQMGEVKLVSPATLPQKPVETSKRKIILLVAFVSLFFGLGTAFLLEAIASNRKQ